MFSSDTMSKLVPVLALLGMGLTALEFVPTVNAHGNKPLARSLEHHHRHLAARAKVQGNAVGAQERRDTAGYIVRRKADGSMCRVKGSKFTPSSSAVTTTTAATSSAAAAPSTTQAQATTTAPAIAAAENQPSPSAGANTNGNNQQQWGQPAPSPSPAPPANNNNNNNGGGSGGGQGGGQTGGWTNSGSKLGLGWPNGNWDAAGSPGYVGNYIGSKSSWYYTWSPWNVGHADSLGIEFVPMLWGPNQLGDWWSQQGSWPSTVKNALFFNEPNQVGQANIAAADSIQYWMNDFVPIRKSKGLALGGAGTTSAPSGLQWILDFQKLCTQYGNSAADCKMDFVPIHWYDTTPQNFQAYVENFHAQTGLDIWITEYACQNFNGGAQCSDGDTWYLHQQMAAWFDSQDYVKRYAPFGVMRDMQGVNQDNALMNPSGDITSLGNWYIWSA